MNTYSGPYKFRLTLGNKDEDRIIIKRELWNEVTESFEKIATFKSPMTLYRKPKVYIIKHKNQILYVGYSSQSITNRLADGMKKAGTFPYYQGYQWKQFDKVELFVFVFDRTINRPKLEEDKKFIHFVQSVEAEIVFLIRSQTGNWPLLQNEIHFFNNN